MTNAHATSKYFVSSTIFVNNKINNDVENVIGLGRNKLEAAFTIDNCIVYVH